MKMKFMSRYVLGVIFLCFVVTLGAHSHHRSHHRGVPRFTTPHDDVFVRPVPVGEAPTVVFYHPAKRPAAAGSNAFKRWVPIGKGKPPCGGKTIYLVQRENVKPAGGPDSLTLEIQVRRETHRIRVQSVQKVRLQNRNHHYVIYSSVGVDFHHSTTDKADKKTSHCVHKPKPKRKMKEPHNSRKQTAALRDTKGSPHRHKLKRHGDCGDHPLVGARFPRSL